MGAFDDLLVATREVRLSQRIGRIREISRGTIVVDGLSDACALGDRVEISGALPMGGEVVRIARDGVTVIADDDPEGLTTGAVVRPVGRMDVYPDDRWLGRVIDPFGNPLDGAPLPKGHVPRPVKALPPPASQRKGLGARLSTGMAVFDTLLPIVQGQRIGLFAGSGVGKSTLLARFATGVRADIVVIAMIGERGRELREFVDHVLGPSGMARSIVVTATSDQSALVRRRCAWTAMAVAEHFRDLGHQVLFLADSITRFAEAHREVAVAAGEDASLRGYPPSTSHMIMSLAERSGPGTETTGDITAVFSVLVAGSDMEEPVADILRGVLDGHVVLDRKIAERGRFPAVDVLRSVSRSLPAAASEGENRLLGEARQLLGAFERSELMVRAGLYVAGTDPVLDKAVRVAPALDRFCAEPSATPEAAFEALSRCLK